MRYSVDHPQAYVRANVQCFVSLLEAMRRQPHTVLVYASSSSVYGTNTKAPFSELDRVEQPACTFDMRYQTQRTRTRAAHVHVHALALIFHVLGARARAQPCMLRRSEWTSSSPTFTTASTGCA